MKAATRPHLLYLCFFISGVAGLIYEIVWSRYLALFVGATGQAHVIILSTYMGGLALGAWLFGRKVDRSPSPLRLYVKLELGIGLLGLIYPTLFEPVRAIFLTIVKTLGLNPVTLNIAAIIGCALTLLLPTTLMGGTLPVLGRYLVRRGNSIGRSISSLYYLNSFGAVLGSLIAGFWMVRTFGFEMTMITAAFLNFLVALMALQFSKRDEHIAPERGESHEVPLENEIEDLEETAGAAPVNIESGEIGLPLKSWNNARIALVVIAFSGFASMVYEVAWIRLMAIMLGSSNYSFAVMLAAFITGITVGSFILSFKKADVGYFRILGWCEVLIGLTALLSIISYQYLPIWVNHWRLSIRPHETTFALYEFGKFLLCFAVMIVPTIFMGASVPAASRVVAEEGMRTIGRRVGNVFAVNTVGTLVGASVAGFIFLPHLGIRHTVEFAVGLNLLLGMWVLIHVAMRRSDSRRQAVWALALCVIVPAVYAVTAPEWDQRALVTGSFRSAKRIPSLAEFQEAIKTRSILYYKDGADASVAVSQDNDPLLGTNRGLVINGKTDASSTHDMLTQLLLGHLPMMTHPDPKDVLVVGLGSGVTAGAVTLYKPDRLDCVELIPEVVEAARYFKQWNHDVCDRPDVNLILQDAKTYLQVTPHKYDVIISEPTNLWITGVAGLFTKEYYAMAREKLKPGGLFLQWIHIYDLPEDALLSLLKTFNGTTAESYFPYSTIFAFDSNDVALIGSTHPFSPDFNRMERLMDDPAIAADFAPFGVRSLGAILSMQIVDKTTTPAPYTSIGPFNTDFFPELEHQAMLGFFLSSRAEAFEMIDRRSWSPARGALWINRYAPAKLPPEIAFKDYYEHNARAIGPFKGLGTAWLNYWEKAYPGSPDLLLARARAPQRGANARLALLSDPVLSSSKDALLLRTSTLLDEYEAERSWAKLPDQTELRRLLQEAAAAFPATAPRLLAALGDLELDAGHPSAALPAYEAALTRFKELKAPPPTGTPSQAAIELKIAQALLESGRFSDARDALAKSINETSLAIEQHLLECRIEQAEQLAAAK